MQSKSKMQLASAAEAPSIPTVAVLCRAAEVSYARPACVSLAKLIAPIGAFELLSLRARVEASEGIRVLIYHATNESIACPALADPAETSLTQSFTQEASVPPLQSTITVLPQPTYASECKLVYDSCEAGEPKRYYIIDLKDLRLKVKILEDGSTAGDVVIVLCGSPVCGKISAAIEVAVSGSSGWTMVKEGKIARVANLFAEGNNYGSRSSRFGSLAARAAKDRVKKASSSSASKRKPGKRLAVTRRLR